MDTDSHWKMSPKENALRIVRFDRPERVVCGLPAYRVAFHGANHQGYDDVGLEDGHDRPVGTCWRDIWNSGWQKEQAGVMGFPRSFPLADPEDLAGYGWPDPDDERIHGPIYRATASFSDGDAVFLTGSHRDTLWEKAYMLTGMENMMDFFSSDPAYAREILHRIMDFQLGIARHYAAVGVEVVEMSDDLGTQQSLILSPSIIEEFLVPEYRRLFDFYKKRQVLISFHSCGHIVPLLEGFVDLGVDILNPVQATANDLSQVLKATRGRMALCGAISSGLVMDGPIEAIRQNVRETIALLGQEGGYFCAPDQSMPYPESHVQAMEEAVAAYGTYPIGR